MHVLNPSDHQNYRQTVQVNLLFSFFGEKLISYILFSLLFSEKKKFLQVGIRIRVGR